MSSRALLALSVGLVVACGSDEEALRSRGTAPSSTSSDGSVEAGAKPGSGAMLDGGVTLIDGSLANPGRPRDAAEDICDTFMARARLLAPDMLIVLDRSGSMNSDGNDRQTDRWTGSVKAIIDVTSAMDKTISFGLMTFPAYVDDDDDADECSAGTLNVKVGSATGPAISAALGPMDADGRTPTAASLQAALTLLDQPLPADTVAPARYVLLVTDGDPNCSGGNTRDVDEAARQQTIAAIEALKAANIKTFVVGYQTAGTEFAAQLDKMAAAGGTGETTHRSVESGADLAAAFEQLAGSVASCSFKLTEPVDDPSYVRVTVANVLRTLDNQADGWTLASDRQTIDLTGAACDAIRGGAQFSAQVECTPVRYY